MNIIRIDKNNQINGEGLRCVVWISGCENHCSHCQNPETWDYNCGHNFSKDDMEIIKSQLSKKEISGITLTGGDPMAPRNRKETSIFCEKIKQLYPQKTIWVYTGHLFEEVQEYCKNIDVLIDGKYVAANNLGIGKHMWRGSYNQRVIDVQKTISSSSIVLYSDKYVGIIDENK